MNINRKFLYTLLAIIGFAGDTPIIACRPCKANRKLAQENKNKKYEEYNKRFLDYSNRLNNDPEFRDDMQDPVKHKEYIENTLRPPKSDES